MKLSTRARYGARAMLELALNYGKDLMTLHDIAQKQEISERYLERIMSILVLAELVISSRGKHGGFCLSKPPSEIRLSQVIQIVEGSLSPVSCLDNPKLCKQSGMCVTMDIWRKMKQAMLDVLDSITLENMIEMQKSKLINSKIQTYSI